MRRRAVQALLAALLLTACGGGGTTLQGTFTDSMYAALGGSRTSCASQEFRNDPAATWKVRVAADNVTAGTAGVHWEGNSAATGSCVATWSMTVPAAQKAYQVTLIAACGGLSSGGTETIASVTVQPAAAGQPVRLSDAASGGNNC